MTQMVGDALSSLRPVQINSERPLIVKLRDSERAGFLLEVRSTLGEAD